MSNGLLHHRRASMMHRCDQEATLVSCIRANLAALRREQHPRAKSHLRSAVRRDAAALRNLFRPRASIQGGAQS